MMLLLVVAAQVADLIAYLALTPLGWAEGNPAMGFLDTAGVVCAKLLALAVFVWGIAWLRRRRGSWRRMPSWVPEALAAYMILAGITGALSGLRLVL
jgi:hypothetical protein